MAATDVTEQRQPPPFFNLFTLNTNRRADLAGLPAAGDFAFLQEVNVSLDHLQSAVGGLGYSVRLSTCDQPKRTIAILSLHPTVTVSELIPGYLQKVIFENLMIFFSKALISFKNFSIFFNSNY